MKPLTEAQRRLLDSSTNQYRQDLIDLPWDHPAQEFMRDRELPVEVQQSFRLGWVGTPYVPDHEQFVGRLVIPNLIVDENGDERVVGQKFRLVDHGGREDTRPKFLYPKGQENRLYNLRDISRARDSIVICEGESDTWVASQVIPAVGVPGVNNWGKQHSYRPRLFQGFSRVILLRDGDEAGETLVRALEPVDGLEVRTPPEPFKDVSEMYQAAGIDAVVAWIEGVE